MEQSRIDALRTELTERAAAVEPNEVSPGSPTLVGWLDVLLADVVELKARVEELERRA